MYERSDKLNKKVFLIIIIVIFTFIMTGCWNSRELNTLGIATAIGIDWVDGQILATVEIINPRPVKGMSEAKPGDLVRYVQGSGDTIFEAARNIALKFDRKVFVSQNRIVIFGEEFAKRGITDYFDVLQRDREFRETAYILIAKGKRATDIMGIYAGIEEIPGLYMENVVENKKFNPKTVDINISEYIKYYYDSGRQPVLGVIDRKEKSSINKINGSENKKEYELITEGCSIFNREKLVGYLDGKETRALNFVRNEIEGGVIEFPTPLNKADDYSTPTPSTESSLDIRPKISSGKSIFEITRSKTKNDLEIKNGKLMLKTKVKMRGMTGEVVGDVDISKQEAIKLMEESCSRQIKEEIENTIKKVQKDNKVDIFGYGNIVHRKYPKEWRSMKDEWDTIFSQAHVEVEVETHIIRTGLVNIPTNKVKGE